MRILGIDPGLILTGYGCVDTSAREPTLVEAGVFRLKAKTPISQRLKQLEEDLTGAMDDLAPDVLAVEKLFAAYKHPRTSILMAHARGVVLLCGARRGLTLIELAATEVKRSVTGHGHASKQQMQRSIMMQCGLPSLPTPSDVADAIGIALTAARRLT